ncbi:HD domain-containing protein [Paenibacillus psychroresistens]|uniref:HD domain-containing protein n=1 Tax=Paenibacillus psychroresistens TaxID=1778678 RepID=A0A6B8RT13_9BACL|nr:HD domain-containing protein [Paenibacillus psychroresistens]QGQ98882.1 HD domain-containing protein [Paenibacillus psychroresistens]
MRMVSIDEVREGDRIGMNVYSSDGRLVLRKGMVVTGKLIDGFKRLHVDGVYIEDERLKDVQMEDSFSVRFRMHAISLLNSAFEEVRESKGFNCKALLETNNEMVRHLLAEQNSLLQINHIRMRTGYLLDHSINVAMLSVLTAKAIGGYSIQQMQAIGIGAMLHDIGYALPGLENPYIEHPKAGHDLLIKQQDIPVMSAELVLQHHEMINADGFPYNLKGKEVKEMAQICAIANDFDHYVNEIDHNRLPHEGMDYVMTKAGVSYDVHIVHAFMRAIVPYPIGTVVLLTNGITGIVIENNKDYESRPVIRELNKDHEISLINHPTLFIKEVVSSRDILFS